MAIAVVVALAPGCLAASQHDSEPTPSPSDSPAANASATPERGTALGLYVAPSGDGSPGGVLIIGAPVDGDDYEAYWVPDVENSDAVGPFILSTPARVARADAESAPRILSRNNASFTLHTLSEGQLVDTESFVVDLGAGEWVGDHFFWSVGPDGEEALVYSLHTPEDWQHGSFLRARTAGGAWHTVTLNPDLIVRDVHALGDRIEILLVGTDGTFHATASYDGTASRPMLVLPPVVGWGINIATDASGGVVALAAEPDYESRAPVIGHGALVATKTDEGWTVDQTGIPYRGSYADLRSGPSTRVILPDPDAKTGNRFAVYAPSEEDVWRKVESYDGFVVNPRFVSGTSSVMVHAPPGDTSTWYSTHAVP